MIRNVLSLDKAWLCLCLICLVLCSCRSTGVLNAGHATSWVMEVRLDKEEQFKLLDADELAPISSAAVEKLGHGLVYFRSNDLLRLQAIKSRLLGLGALDVRISRVSDKF